MAVRSRVGGGGWLRMRDGRSKTAPIINHRMIHSIVPSPRVRSFVPPQNQIPERKLELSRKRSPLLPGESLPRPCEGGNLSPLEPGRPRDSPYPLARSHARPAISLAANHPTHPLTLLNQPPLSSSVRSFLLSSTPLQIAPISRAVNFIFPRHFPLAAPHRVDPLPRPRGLSIFEKL